MSYVESFLRTALRGSMENSSPRMAGGTREAPVNSSPAVAANAEGEEIEVLESTDVFPVAPEEVSPHTQHRRTLISIVTLDIFYNNATRPLHCAHGYAALPKELLMSKCYDVKV